MSNARNLANLLESDGDIKVSKAIGKLNNSLDSSHYVDGSIDDEHISGISASKLTGDLPAISGALLTGIDSLPSQTGQSGKSLTTDGTVASWDVVVNNTLDFANFSVNTTTGMLEINYYGDPSNTNFSINANGELEVIV